MTIAGAKGAKWLAQGTIYPDVIGVGRRQEQEGRHDQEPPQRRCLPEQLGLSCSNRCATCSRTSARTRRGARPAARDGIPTPFPDGLGVRDLGEVRRSTRTCCAAPKRFIEEMRTLHRPCDREELDDLTSQAFTVFLPVKRWA